MKYACSKNTSAIEPKNMRNKRKRGAKSCVTPVSWGLWSEKLSPSCFDLPIHLLKKKLWKKTGEA